jgi:hypothetical protein
MNPVEVRQGTESIFQNTNLSRYVTQKPGNKITEKNGFVCFLVTGRTRDTSYVPQIAFPFI